MLEKIKNKVSSLFKKKNGFMDVATISKLFLGLVIVTVLFVGASVLIPEAQAAGDSLEGNLTANNTPFATFFGADGLIWLALIAGLVIAIIGIVLGAAYIRRK